MIKEYQPIVQALLGTCFTWAVTAAGALMVIFFRGTQPKLLDTSLGFAAGVMTAASYWSLLGPAIEMAKESNVYGASGQYAFIPACLGFLLGAAFTFAADVLISKMGIDTPNLLLANYKDDNDKKTDGLHRHRCESSIYIDPNTEVSDISVEGGTGTITRRRVTTQSRHRHPTLPQVDLRLQWKRILLLIIAITVHNIPEGLAVGVGFGAIGTSTSASFYKARNLAIGIGIQNFPEGLAVSLPLKAAGFSTLTAFCSNPKDILTRIVTGDENWVHHYDPESKQKSMQWRRKGDKPPDKFKTTPSAGKILATIFWDAEGILMIDYKDRYGQLSGMVEPVFGLIGALLVTAAEPLLPYALAFAAGAMIYVVVDDIIPEANTKGNGSLASWGAICGFMVMMVLEVALQ